ncbi:NAD-dependent epimerase/dehydratase family protein [Streptosporangium sp. LJ11]|uniref:NAD-dependent epimerase/dehydratase family protein n=1 Tax=Streptosporangium sp. LJ11 TaxID=3436927 RepID=UPI003F78C395
MARHLGPLRGVHPGVVVLAAGVPRQQLPDSEHEREIALVRETIPRCRRQGRTLVFFSTVSMYGGPGCRGREDDPIVPSTRYGRHKLDLERLIRGSGVDHLILRLGYVLGPGGPGFRLVPALVEQILSGRVQVYEGARRDILYVADFVTVFDRLLETGTTNQVVNVASGDCVEIVRVVEHLERCLNVTAEHDMLGRANVSHCPSVEKIRALVPEAAFARGYHRYALERYLAETR